MENRSPISDLSCMFLASGKKPISRSSRDIQASLLPPINLARDRRSPVAEGVAGLPADFLIMVPKGTSTSLMARRFRIADKLCRARPDLAAPSYAAKRDSWRLRSQVREQYREGLRSISDYTAAEISIRMGPHRTLPLEDTEDVGVMDWERSRALTEKIRAQLEKGDRVSLPALECLNSQLEDV